MYTSACVIEQGSFLPLPAAPGIRQLADIFPYEKLSYMVFRIGARVHKKVLNYIAIIQDFIIKIFCGDIP